MHRHKWYTSLIQALFAILGVHQVKQACKTEIAALFNYPLVPDTQNNWQDTRAFRAEQQHEIEVKQLKQDKVEIKCGSVDEFKLGSDWAYTLTDTSSQAVVSYQQSSTREETTVRDVISVIPPKAIISDGCLAIQAGAAWWSDIAHGRCWFHVMQSLSRLASREKDESGVSERQHLIWHVQFLLSQPSLVEAERYLKILKGLHSEQLLEPLLNAWSELSLHWSLGLPVTNNTSETLYNAVWSRERKRVVKTVERAGAWLSEALFRWNHHFVRGFTPWERLTGRSSKPWLEMLVMSVGRRLGGSTYF